MRMSGVTTTRRARKASGAGHPAGARTRSDSISTRPNPSVIAPASLSGPSAATTCARSALAARCSAPAPIAASSASAATTIASRRFIACRAPYLSGL